MASKWGLVLAAVVCVSCADDAPPTGPSGSGGRADPRPGIRRVEGRVVDYASNAPLGGLAIGFGGTFPAVDVQTTTDAMGAYRVDLPTGEIVAYLDSQYAGTMAVHVGGPAYRGDLVGTTDVNCISRYGTVTDAQSFRPVAGATVGLGGGTAVSAADGWYRIDLGCVYNPYNNSSTTFIRASHPSYHEYSRVVGRGIHRVNRLDIELQRP